MSAQKKMTVFGSQLSESTQGSAISSAFVKVDQVASMSDAGTATSAMVKMFFHSQPSAGDKVTLAGRLGAPHYKFWTFVTGSPTTPSSSDPTTFQVQIGSTISQTIDNVLAFMNSNPTSDVNGDMFTGGHAVATDNRPAENSISITGAGDLSGSAGNIQGFFVAGICATLSPNSAGNVLWHGSLTAPFYGPGNSLELQGNLTIRTDSGLYVLGPQDGQNASVGVSTFQFNLNTSMANSPAGHWVADLYDQGGALLKSLSGTTRGGTAPVTLNVTQAGDASADQSSGGNLIYLCAPDKFANGGSIQLAIYGKLGTHNIDGVLTGSAPATALSEAVNGNGVYKMTLPFKVENI